VLTDLAAVEHKWDRRPRPYPYATNVNLTLVAAAAIDTYGVWTLLVPRATYNFGDIPNEISIVEVGVENISAIDVYVVELGESANGGATVNSIGALRFRTLNLLVRSFILPMPGREVNNDVYAIYGRVKTLGGTGPNVTVGLAIARHISTSIHIPASTGVFPFG